jgi:hypothetical protein
MTDPIPSPDALDELVSAVLDGEADASERARVEADPVLRARLAELRAVRDQVAAEVPPLDAITATRLRLAALDATTDATRPVRGPQSARVGRWLASVAAVVLLIAVAIPVLGSLGGDGDFDSADSGGDEASETSDLESLTGSDVAQESSDGGEADASEEFDRSMADDPASLGSFDSDLALAREALATRLRGDTAATPDDDLEQPTADPETSGSAGSINTDHLSSCPFDGDGTLIGVLVARVGGDARLVRVVESSDGTRSAEVIDPDTCEVVADAP